MATTTLPSATLLALSLLIGSALSCAREDARPLPAQSQPPQTPSPAQPQPKPISTPTITHGVASGAVHDDQATIWARTSAPTNIHVSYWPQDAPQDIKQVSSKTIAADDNTVRVTLTALKPKQRYTYRLDTTAPHDASPHDTANIGELQTPPSPKEEAAVSFAWSGDLGGQNICRGIDDGYPIFKHIPARSLDFFIALGDMIYADNTCRPQGRFKRAQHPGLQQKATKLQDYWAAWRYNREDQGYKQLLSQTSIYAVWDDHEVVNNFGPSHDRRADAPYKADVALMPLGRKAFIDYNPVNPTASSQDPTRFYKRVRWGKHLELFFLDTRQYRAPNAAPDTAEAPKSMLGKAQRDWLVQSLSTTDATWKVVISSVPIAIPTGNYGKSKGIDSWSKGRGQGKTGFSRELDEIWRQLAKNKVHNQLWLTTDVHFGAVFRYKPYPKAHPQFQVYELIAGPLSAMLFPFFSFDRTFHPERLWMYGPKHKNKLKTFAQALPWMNFGQLDISAQGQLNISYTNGLGQRVYQLALTPQR